MTTKAHSTLTGSDLHEPKGVAAAGNGTVYVADGLGSGSWSTLSSQAGSVKQVNYYSSSATITIPTGCTTARVCMWGAGGGGGSTNNGNYPGGGAGSGGYSESYFTGLTPSNTLTFTKGSGGAAGPTTGNISSNNGGSAGGTTTLASGTQTISTMTCNGGGAGGAASGGSLGGSGGSCSGGNILNLSGVSGCSTSQGAAGGTFMFSKGGQGTVSLTGPVAGVAGSDGGLIIYWMS